MNMDLERLRRHLAARQPTLMDNRGRFAVLVPLVEEEDGTFSLLYEVRAGTLRRQPGEVCFPGGRIEGDETAAQCALRETWEELAIPPEDVTVVGELDYLYHRANFIMYPVVGRISWRALEHMTPSPAEVGQVFRVPLSQLLAQPPMECPCEMIPIVGENFPYEIVGIPRTYQWLKGGETVYVYPREEHSIWGLTARITRNLLGMMEQAQ